MRRGLLLAVVAILTLAAGAAATGRPAERVPSNFVRHQGAFGWVWYGPKKWVASYAANGITITDPVGTAVVDFGASQVYCDGTPAQHFKTRRRQLKGELGLSGTRFRHVSAVKPGPDGTSKQTFEFRGTNRKGQGVRGDIELVYGYLFDNYCISSDLYRYSYAKGWKETRKTLRAIWKSTFQTAASG